MKKRYLTLDVLRACAGLTVPLLHLSEPFTGVHDGTPGVKLLCGHGYLPVEFFLLLMGYMLGFAYDRRWQQGMTTWDFFKRRIKRLHPCVLSGLVLGLIVYGIQLVSGEAFFPWLKKCGTGEMSLIVLVSALMIPAFWTVLLAPLNACTWTLYFEYFGNILYALFVRRLGKGLLLALAILSGLWAASLIFMVDLNALFGTNIGVWKDVAGRNLYSLVGGWGTEPNHIYSGFVRLMFPLFLGMFLWRLGWKISLPAKIALPLATIVFVAILFAPYPYGNGLPTESRWLHGCFEMAVITLVFPLLILIGVGNEPVACDTPLARAGAFLAELSYPLYMSHYPIMELHNCWVRHHSHALSPMQCVLISAAEYVLCLVVAWGVMAFWNRTLYNRPQKERT